MDNVVSRQRKKTGFVLLIALALLVLALSLVNFTGFAILGNAQADTITIGATFPLTGELSVYGEAYKNGAILAQEEINRNGGIDGKKLKISFQDNKGDAKTAVGDVMYLINVERVPIILNSMEYLTLASKDIAEKNKVIMLTFTTYLLSEKDDPRYLYKDSWDFGIIGRGFGEAANGIGSKRLAVVRLKDSSYSDLQSSFFGVYNGIVVIDETYNFGEKDFRTILAKIKNEDVDTILVYSYPVDVGLILKQMAELDMRSYNLITAEGTEQYAMSRNLDLLQSTHAISYMGSELQGPDWFVREYKERFGADPRPDSYYAYDSVTMFGRAMGACGDDVDCIRKEISVNFDEFHNRERVLPIVRYDGGWYEIDVS
ncbi:MAG: ABC transporter substrate-binding protein [archaeon]